MSVWCLAALRFHCECQTTRTGQAKLCLMATTTMTVQVGCGGRRVAAGGEGRSMVPTSFSQSGIIILLQSEHSFRNDVVLVVVCCRLEADGML